VRDVDVLDDVIEAVPGLTFPGARRPGTVVGCEVSEAVKSRIGELR
jgi:hypothetical protein